jgi:hypothetical protein
MEPAAKAVILAIDPSKQIRVLALEPGSLDDQVTGNFEIITLHSDSFYPIDNSIGWDAISYV